MTDLAQKQHLVSKVAARKNGAAITFTIGTGTYDPSTDTWSSASTSTVTGYARRVRGEPERYARLGLVESEAPTLEFTPDTFGEIPPQLATCSFGGVTYAVRDVNPWAPAGSAVSCQIVVAR
jgi:hypothetical protein